MAKSVKSKTSADLMAGGIEAVMQSIVAADCTLGILRMDVRDREAFPSIALRDRELLRMYGGQFVRQAVCGEFDLTDSPGARLTSERPVPLEGWPTPHMSPALKALRKHVPPLWVLVTEITRDWTTVKGIWRGNAATNAKVVFRNGFDVMTFRSDTEQNAAIDQFIALNGHDAEAWDVFLNKLMEVAAKQATLTGKRQWVN